MPVIVIGADTEYGMAVATALTGRGGEVRGFVTDPESAPPLRELGIKVAVGDVSDASHISASARRVFSAVVVAESGLDDRERSFATSFDALLTAWAEGLKSAGVNRIIWVGTDADPPTALVTTGAECVSIDVRHRSPAGVAAEVVRLDDLAVIDPG